LKVLEKKSKKEMNNDEDEKIVAPSYIS
jgi:hypothetical protein